MTRVANSVRNAKVSTTFLLLTLLMTFFSRKIFIDTLGTDLVGLTSTLQNVLGFLNLAELGIGAAVASMLYKPLYEKDERRINDIISIFSYLYRIIGFSVLAIGLVVSLFLPLFFKNSGVELVDIYGGYFTFLITTLVGYFISYRQTLLDADQKQYVIVALTNIAMIGKLAVQIILLKHYGGGYIEWLAVELVFGIIYGFWINSKVTKRYPWLQTSFSRGRLVRKEYRDLFRTIKNVIPHKIGTFVLMQTSSILVYTFTSLAMVTIYTNYTMILTRAVQIVAMVFNGVGGSVGNLVAEGNKKDIKKVFWELHFFFFLLGSVLVICGFYLTDPFIHLWLGDGFELEPVAFYLLLLNSFIGVIRLPINLYLNAYVLFKDVWAPCTEATVNLLTAIVLGYFYGIAGVMSGATVSLLLIVVLWKPYFLYHEGFKEKVSEYWRGYIRYILVLIITWFIVEIAVRMGILLDNTNFFNWIINALALLILSGSVYSILSMFFCRGGKDVLRRTVSVMGRRK